MVGGPNEEELALKLLVAALSLLAFFGLAVSQANTQVLTTLHNFTSGSDGAGPYLNELTVDAAGNIFGVTNFGGASGVGIVFELVKSNGTYSEKVLHTFTNSPGDGAYPYGGITIDSQGNLFGTTSGGGTYGVGTVYEFALSSIRPVRISSTALILSGIIVFS